MNTETKNEMVVFADFENALAEFTSQHDGVVYDLTVPEQKKTARADKHAIGKVISRLDKAHAEKKAPLKLETDKLDSDRKRIKDGLLGLQENIKSQLEAHEKKAADIAEALQDRVTEIVELGVDYPGDNPTKLAARLEEAKAIIVDDSFEDRKADATLAQVDSIKYLEDKLEAANKHEAEQKELAELREKDEKREREDREREIVKEATEKATKMAEEDAAKEKKEADEKRDQEIEDAKKKQEEAEEAARQAEKDAEQEITRQADEALEEIAIAQRKQKQAEKDAAEAVETAKREEHDKIIRQQAEKKIREDAEKDDELRKKQKKQYRNRIRTEAIESLAAGLVSEDVVDEEKANTVATEIVDMIDADSISHISIIY